MFELSDNLVGKRDRLLDLIRSFGSCAVAFSGGVDSTVVAKAAQLTLAERAIAVTGISASLPEGEAAETERLAALLGIRYRAIHTLEFSNDAYLRNAPDRCYHCKTELYNRLAEMTGELDVAVIANGANLDDQGDYRPGMQAATEQGVRSPLVECQLTKDEVRQLAAAWDLPIWDKPASPCLSSRVAYGEEVTPQRLRMIDKAEQFLRRHGLGELRVRFHAGDVARVEVPLAELLRLIQSPLREELIEHLHALGFKYVTIDVEGFRSGSLNKLVELKLPSLEQPLI